MMTETISNIAVAGADGRMGRMLIEAVLDTPDLRLTGALLPKLPESGQVDAGLFIGRKTGVIVEADLVRGLAGADCLIDFTRPEGALKHLDYCVENGIRMVIGTTGFDAGQKKRIADAATRIPIVFAPNMSIGVNVTLKILEMTAPYFAGYDVEIIEAHHRNKADAPSGTALAMGEAVARALSRNLDEVAVFDRHGHTGVRDRSSIGFSTIRGGDIVGDHTVFFAGIGERIEISHKSSSRASYAQGSLIAARFLMNKTSGLFDMRDVLGL